MEHSFLGTTPNAPEKVEAVQVSERTKDAANQAASVAKTLGSSYTGEPVDQLKTDASKTTEAAVSEGKRDVEQAKLIGAGYVEQAKSLANNVLENVQNYLPTALGGKPMEPVPTSQEAPNLIDPVKNMAANVYATALSTAEPLANKLKGTTSAVTDAAQPHVEGTKETARSTSDAALSYIETAQSVAKSYLDNLKQSAQAVVESAGIENTKAKVQGSMGIGADAVEGPELQKITESKIDTVKSPKTTMPLASDIISNEIANINARN